MNILVCSIIRDRQPCLRYWKSQLQRLIAWYPDWSFDLAVYENDSKDGSDEYVKTLEIPEFGNIYAKSEVLGWKYFGSVQGEERVANLAKARNTAMSLPPSLDKYDHIIWVEPDIIYTKESATRIIDAHVDSKAHITSGYSWHQGPGIIYDTWATRPHPYYPHHPYQKGFIPVLATWNCFVIYDAAGFRAGAKFEGGDCDTAVICFNYAKLGFSDIFIVAQSWCRHESNGWFANADFELEMKKVG